MGLNFPWPFLDYLVIPTDAGPNDDRIVINDPVGTISVYVGGTAVIQLRGGETGIIFNIANPAGTGFLDSFNFGTQRGMRLSPPLEDAADDRATFILLNEDESGADATTFLFRDENDGTPVDLLQVYGSSVSDMFFDHISSAIPRLSLPRGLVATTGQVTSNEGAYTTDTTSTSMVLNNVPHVAGREYLFVLNGLEELSANTGSWQNDLLLNGSYIGTFSRITNEAASLTRHEMNGVVSWIAPNTSATDDFALLLDERTGTADITLIGGATATSPPRILSCYDMGAP